MQSSIYILRLLAERVKHCIKQKVIGHLDLRVILYCIVEEVTSYDFLFYAHDSRYFVGPNLSAACN